MIPKNKFLSFTGNCLALAGLLFITACNNNDDDGIGPEELAYVGIYHASPDTEGLDILVGSSGKLNETAPFTFGDYITYKFFYPGNREIKLAKVASPGAVVVDTTLTFVNSKYYTIFVADSLSRLETVVFGDSTTVSSTGKAVVRLIHMSPDAPVLDVVSDENSLFESTGFKEGTAFKEIDAGTITLDFRAADGDQEVVLSVPNVEFKAQRIYSIILRGVINSPSGNTRKISTDIITH